MRSDIKHLGLGLTIGFSITAIFATAIILLSAFTSPSPIIPLPPAIVSSTPTFSIATAIAATLATADAPTTIQNPSTPTFIASPTESPTDTPTPTATLTSVEQMLMTGQLVFSGPLSPAEQIRLYQSSIEFIAPTTKQAKQVGVTINGVGYGSPTLICGPLSLAILQDAGLIDTPNVVPYNFWLLNPYVPEDRTLVNRVFPWEKYQNRLFETPLNKFDWRSFPLEPGDFLFIKHGSGGNFDHMLVVSRVDNFGRRYAVTNYNTPDGYIINEALLYDPSDSTVGLFHTWTARPYAVEGATGFGGFELWRRRP